MERDTDGTRSRRRILRFLSNGPATVSAALSGEAVLLEASGGGTIAVAGSVLSELVADGILVRAARSIALSGEGAELARRLEPASGTPEDRRRDIDIATLASREGPTTVLVNLAESPLAQLVRRKTKDGKPFLTAREFQAGERLRADYTRGQIMPRMGANWVASVSSGRRASGGGLADLTDAALAARQRVENAVAEVGPELSGVLVDVCCFLKGLELVEAERGWPVRSAKIVLKTALGVLARHYFPAQGRSSTRAYALHWGAQDYRPKIS